ncbi:hypothetical protein KI387_026823, partial [Taxus chinensis]
MSPRRWTCHQTPRMIKWNQGGRARICLLELVAILANCNAKKLEVSFKTNVDQMELQRAKEEESEHTNFVFKDEEEEEEPKVEEVFVELKAEEGYFNKLASPLSKAMYPSQKREKLIEEEDFEGLFLSIGHEYNEETLSPLEEFAWEDIIGISKPETLEEGDVFASLVNEVEHKDEDGILQGE